jgi:hypothetical protein
MNDGQHGIDSINMIWIVAGKGKFGAIVVWSHFMSEGITFQTTGSNS